MTDHAGYFIQMGVSSIPIWMEGMMDKTYQKWLKIKRLENNSAQSAPAGLRVLEKVVAGAFLRDSVVVCYPDNIHECIGPNTKVVALSTHNPLGVAFAAGGYTSILGSSRSPINSHYARKLYPRKPLKSKTRAELIASVKPSCWKYLREDAGDLPQGAETPAGQRELATA